MYKFWLVISLIGLLVIIASHVESKNTISVDGYAHAIGVCVNEGVLIVVNHDHMFDPEVQQLMKKADAHCEK